MKTKKQEALKLNDSYWMGNCPICYQQYLIEESYDADDERTTYHEHPLSRKDNCPHFVDVEYDYNGGKEKVYITAHETVHLVNLKADCPFCNKENEIVVERRQAENTFQIKIKDASKTCPHFITAHNDHNLADDKAKFKFREEKFIIVPCGSTNKGLQV